MIAVFCTDSFLIRPGDPMSEGRIAKPAKAKSEPPMFAEAVVGAAPQLKDACTGLDDIEIAGGEVTVGVPMTAEPNLICTIIAAMRGDR